MKKKMMLVAVTAVLLVFSGSAMAAGELNFYNWGNYTNPELVKKFEEKYGIKITITDYDSNSTMLAKVKAGGHGFDIVCPSANYVKIMREEGLLLEVQANQLENFKNVAPEWRDPDWDPGRRYSVPWQWGTVGMVVDTEFYKGDINTSSIVFDPPPELQGKISVPPEMGDVMALVLMYVGSEPCTTDKAALKKARDVLMNAKQHWVSIDYGLTEKMPRGDYNAAAYWNGAAFRARLAKPSIRFGYPREGYPVWMDSVVILKTAKKCGKRQAVHELYHGTGKCSPDLQFCPLCQGHYRCGKVHARRHEYGRGNRRSRRVQECRGFRSGMLQGGQRLQHGHLDGVDQVKRF